MAFALIPKSKSTIKACMGCDGGIQSENTSLVQTSNPNDDNKTTLGLYYVGDVYNKYAFSCLAWELVHAKASLQDHLDNLDHQQYYISCLHMHWKGISC